MNRILANREAMLEVVKFCGDALRFCHRDIRADRVVVLAAVKTDGLTLQYAGGICRWNF